MSSLLTQVHAQLGIIDPIPPEFIQGFVFNFFLAWAFFGTSLVISPYLWGSSFPDEKKMLWHTTFIAMVQPFYVGYVTWPEIKRGMEYWIISEQGRFDTKWLSYKPTPTIYYATGLSLGFMFMDTVAMVIWAKPLIKAMRLPFYKQMWLHHIFSLIIWPYALCSHKGVLCVIYYVFTEVTNPCLNMRWMLGNKAGWAEASNSYVCVCWVLLLWYFIVRVVPLPWYLFHLFRPQVYMDGGGNALTWFQMGICLLTCPIPFMLNGFWFKLMLRPAIRKFKEMIGMQDSSSSGDRKEGKKTK